VDILIKHGDGMNLIKLILGMMLLVISIQGEEMKKIELKQDLGLLINPIFQEIHYQFTFHFSI